MKKKILLLFILFQLIFIFSCSNIRYSSSKLINLRSENVLIDKSKINYFIILSKQSCHDCYNDIQKYILRNNIYNDTNKVISVIAIDTKINIKSVAVRKNYYNISKEYFPEINNIYYSNKLNGNIGLLFGERISIIGNPIIFVINNREIIKYKYEEFINLGLID